MKKLLVVAILLALALPAFAGSKHEYTYNSNYNYNKDVAMTNAIGGIALNLFALGSAANSGGSAAYSGGGGNSYYGNEGYGGSVIHGTRNVVPVAGFIPVNNYTPAPRICVWVPTVIQGQITGYIPFCN